MSMLYLYIIPPFQRLKFGPMNDSLKSRTQGLTFLLLILYVDYLHSVRRDIVCGNMEGDTCKLRVLKINEERLINSVCLTINKKVPGHKYQGRNPREEAECSTRTQIQ